MTERGATSSEASETRADTGRAVVLLWLSALAFWVCVNVMNWLGGSALSAMDDPGRYVLVNHGETTQVSRATWRLVAAAECGAGASLLSSILMGALAWSKGDLTRPGSRWRWAIVATIVAGLAAAMAAEFVGG